MAVMKWLAPGDKYTAGAPCTVNTSGDRYMAVDERPFFGVPCVVVKRTKAGLIMVALQSDEKRTYSFPQRNVDLVPDEMQLYVAARIAAAIDAERERCGEVFNMARICAENNMKRGDDCGALARKLLAALNALKA